jgi:hypothetical protein
MLNHAYYIYISFNDDNKFITSALSFNLLELLTIKALLL